MRRTGVAEPAASPSALNVASDPQCRDLEFVVAGPERDHDIADADERDRARADRLDHDAAEPVRSVHAHDVARRSPRMRSFTPVWPMVTAVLEGGRHREDDRESAR